MTLGGFALEYALEVTLLGLNKYLTTKSYVYGTVHHLYS